MQTMTVSDEPETVHIPAPMLAGFDTLCGYVDVKGYQRYDHEEKPVNCPTCIRTFRAIRAMKAPRSYFANKKPKAGRDGGRCAHGVRKPHECKECIYG